MKAIFDCSGEIYTCDVYIGVFFCINGLFFVLGRFLNGVIE